MTSDLDIEQASQLIGYLRSRERIEPAETPAVEVLPGGVSCRTVRVDRASGVSWVIKQALPQLRVEVDWFSNPERIHREALAMEMLRGLVPPGSLPRLAFEDREQDLVAMDAVPLPNDQWKHLLLTGRLESDHVRQFGALLATIHRETRARSDRFAAAFADRSNFETLRLEAYYEYSGRQRPAAAAFLAGLSAETRSNLLTATHGDYSPKNVLVHDGRLVLLDHETMHWGDGAFDLGFALTHLLAKSLHVEGMRRPFLEAALLFWDTYSGSVGEPFIEPAYEARVARHTVACALARAVGKSPLEYLDQAERERQAGAAMALTSTPPQRVTELIERFDEAAGSTP